MAKERVRWRARLAVAALVAAGIGQAAPSLMPLPAKMTPGSGRLAIDGSFHVALAGPSDEPRVHGAAMRLIERLSEQTGIPLDRGLAKSAAAATLVVEWSDDGLPVQKLGEDESYELRVDGKQARLHAKTPLGVIWGMQTFLQLVETDGQGFAVNGVAIEDRPRFPWRGLLIDVSRHFMPLDVVLRNIDGMSAVKLNVLHWHLSDDQGFRVESRRFPRLQEMGSDGMYYTQAQIRHVVEYARMRGVRVVPEFDMPGHSLSWLVGYPELATSPGPFQIGRHFGGFEALIDPTKDTTYQFIDSFLGEMSGLFPDEYFHIGGDEVNDKEWRENPQIQQFIQTNHLDGSRGLQAYFNKRVQPMLARYGKHVEGWDEILNPDLPRNIVIQSWRGQKSLAEAAKLGFQGILSSGYYLDLEYPAAKHYMVDPLENETAGLTAAEQALILGGEAAIWSEFVSPETIDSRTWPRLAAIAERLWSPADVKDVDSMYARMAVMSLRLDALGLRHRSNYAEMLRRIAGPGPWEPVRVLADATEPSKGYSREEKHYVQQTPLNRLVDAARPESDEARRFAALVKKVLADRDETGMGELRMRMETWKDNDAKLEPVMQASFLAQDNAALSKQLAEVAGIGLEALRAIETRKGRTAAWVKEKTDALDAMKKKRAEMMVPEIAAVEELVAASAAPAKAPAKGKHKKG